MAHVAVLVLFVVVGLINFAPLVGVISAERLGSLYGVAFEDPNLVVLMRHRAVLFGILGGGLLYSVYDPAVRPFAAAMVFVSMASFVVLAAMTGGYNEYLGRVLWIDVIAIVLLAVALVAERFSPS